MLINATMITGLGNTENICNPWHMGWEMKSFKKLWIHCDISCIWKLDLACFYFPKRCLKAVF